MKKGIEHGKINQLTREQAAYIAGILDADGCVTVGGQTASSALVIVTNSDYSLIRWLKKTIGAGTDYETKTRPTRADQDRANWNCVHRYQITHWKAQVLLEQCLPYMRVKRKRAELVIRIPVRGRDFGRGKSKSQVRLIGRLRTSIRALNSRGLKKPLYAT